MPFREDNPIFPNNRSQALKRAEGVKRKMMKDTAFHDEYTKFMMKLVNTGYARKAVSHSSEVDSCWFLPHHAVFHPTKKNPGCI